MLAQSSRARIALAFASIYIVWGSTYLAIRFAVETIPPFFMAGTRFLVSGVILYAFARSRGAPVPPRRQWRAALVVGFLLLVAGNGAVVWAEQSVPSGLTALLVSVVPFWLVLIEWLRPEGHRPKAAVVLGLLLGLVGIFVLVNPTAGTQATTSLLAAGVLMFGSLAWAAGSIYSRHADLPDSGFMRTAIEMVCGGVVLFVVGFLAGESAQFKPHAITAASAWGVIYLIAFGSLVGFTSYIWLLHQVSPARVGTYAYVNPLVAVLLGWAIAGETLSARTVVAAAIVIGAVAIITTSQSSEPRSPDGSAA